MGKKIRILVSELRVEAELNESKTSQLIWEALPIEAKANLWGEEIYFTIPVKTILEAESREVISAGELGYWPTGHAFCISDPKVFLKVKEGAKITLERA